MFSEVDVLSICGTGDSCDEAQNRMTRNVGKCRIGCRAARSLFMYMYIQLSKRGGFHSRNKACGEMKQSNG